MTWIIIIILIIYIIVTSYKKTDVPKSARLNSYTTSYPRKQTQSQIVNKKLNEDQIFIEDIKLSDEQQKLFDRIENSSDHFFITGKAGTGKSVLLQYLKYKSKKRMVVGALTGVAALNVHMKFPWMLLVCR